MSYDPTLPPNSAGAARRASRCRTARSPARPAPPASRPSATRAGPATLLDQMWIRFDILDHVFVTAGKQHVHWGTGRFWQPTDYLHQQKRNPLDVFDARPGTTMLKLNVPWEEKGWNFYGFAGRRGSQRRHADDRRTWPAPSASRRSSPASSSAPTPICGAGRGRATASTSRRASRTSTSTPTSPSARAATSCTSSPPSGRCPPASTRSPATRRRSVGGINYSRKYNDNDAWTVGVEYFYNHPGYDNASAYPALLRAAFLHGDPSAFPFFYLGRHYGGASTLTLPGALLLELHDLHPVDAGEPLRQVLHHPVDYSVTVLTHLSVEAFAGVHYGHSAASSGSSCRRLSPPAAQRNRRPIRRADRLPRRRSGRRAAPQALTRAAQLSVRRSSPVFFLGRGIL